MHLGFVVCSEAFSKPKHEGTCGQVPFQKDMSLCKFACMRMQHLQVNLRSASKPRQPHICPNLTLESLQARNVADERADLLLQSRLITIRTKINKSTCGTLVVAEGALPRLPTSSFSFSSVRLVTGLERCARSRRSCKGLSVQRDATKHVCIKGPVQSAPVNTAAKD